MSQLECAQRDLEIGQISRVTVVIGARRVEPFPVVSSEWPAWSSLVVGLLAMSENTPQKFRIMHVPLRLNLKQARDAIRNGNGESAAHPDCGVGTADASWAASRAK